MHIMFIYSNIICSSLLNPHYLRVSIPNSAIPPLSFISILLCHLQSISTHLALHLYNPSITHHKTAINRRKYEYKNVTLFVHSYVCITVWTIIIAVWRLETTQDYLYLLTCSVGLCNNEYHSHFVYLSEPRAELWWAITIRDSWRHWS